MSCSTNVVKRCGMASCSWCTHLTLPDSVVHKTENQRPRPGGPRPRPSGPRPRPVGQDQDQGQDVSAVKIEMSV